MLSLKCRLLYHFLYFWLRRYCMCFSTVAGSGGYQLWCTGFSLQWLLPLCSRGSRARGLQWLWPVGSAVAAPRFKNTGSIVGARGFSFSVACGFSPDQGSNSGLLYWQAECFLPLSHQGSPKCHLLIETFPNHYLKLCSHLHPITPLSPSDMLYHRLTYFVHRLAASTRR